MVLARRKGSLLHNKYRQNRRIRKESQAHGILQQKDIRMMFIEDDTAQVSMTNG